MISRHQNAKLTYDDLDVQSGILARGLERAGVQKGDRVAVMLGNGVEYCVVSLFQSPNTQSAIKSILTSNTDHICPLQTWCYTRKSHRVPEPPALIRLMHFPIQVPLNPAFNALQITSALTHLAASHLVISSETNLPYKAPRSAMPLLAHLIPDLQKSKVESEAVPSLKNVIVVDNSKGRVETKTFGALRNYTDVLDDGQGGELGVRDLDADEVVNIQFTSGTTSMP